MLLYKSFLKKKCIVLGIVIFVFTFPHIYAFEQKVYERRVIAKYAPPGSDPAQVEGFNYTIPETGTWQVEIIPDRVSLAIHGIPIVIDVAVGILFQVPDGTLRRGTTRYRKGPWRHGIGNAFVTIKISKDQQIRIWYSASIGGMPCPDVWGKVRIFRIE